jgi:hypothetical protein
MAENNWYWQDADPDAAKAMNSATDSAERLHLNTSAKASRDFRNTTTYTDVRSDFTKDDYFYFRDTERVPEKRDDIINLCSAVYEKCGIVNNFINLMSEFGSMGVAVQHPNPRINKYYQEWWKKVRGSFVSERILSNLFSMGCSVIEPSTISVTARTLDKLLVKSADSELGQIPIHYTFLNPRTVDVDKNDKIGELLGDPQYVLKLPAGLKAALSTATQDQLKQLSPQFLEAIRSGKKTVPLSPSTHVLHYRKNDWEVWSKPVTYCILDDIINYQKMKLCDRVALDGAISKVRVWKLGSLENKIIPTDNAIAKFTSMLTNNFGAGFADIVWTPAIDLLESKSETFQFLGEDKYKPTLAAIYAGFGVPSLVAGQGGSGMTNNFMAVKILIERLMYARLILIEFWEGELEKVRRAKGFRLPARLTFEEMELTEESAILKLYIELWDRGVISDESLRSRFDEDTLMEEVRIRRENKLRDAEKINPKTGPFYAVPIDKEFELQKIKLQKVNKAAPGGGPAKKPPGKAGRPTGAKDNKKRKQRKPKPLSNKSKAEWAIATQFKVLEVLTPALEHTVGNLQGLTSEGAMKVAARIYAVLRAMPIGSEPTEEEIIAATGNVVDLATLNSLYFRAEPSALDDCLKLNISAYLMETEDGQD